MIAALSAGCGWFVEAAGVRGGDLVVDLGAGTGALTRPLLAAGARVLAVELHPGRAAGPSLPVRRGHGGAAQRLPAGTAVDSAVLRVRRG